MTSENKIWDSLTLSRRPEIIKKLEHIILTQIHMDFNFNSYAKKEVGKNSVGIEVVKFKPMSLNDRSRTVEILNSFARANDIYRIDVGLMLISLFPYLIQGQDKKWQFDRTSYAKTFAISLVLNNLATSIASEYNHHLDPRSAEYQTISDLLGTKFKCYKLDSTGKSIKMNFEIDLSYSILIEIIHGTQYAKVQCLFSDPIGQGLSNCHYSDEAVIRVDQLVLFLQTVKLTKTGTFDYSRKIIPIYQQHKPKDKEFISDYLISLGFIQIDKITYQFTNQSNEVYNIHVITDISKLNLSMTSLKKIENKFNIDLMDFLVRPWTFIKGLDNDLPNSCD